VIVLPSFLPYARVPPLCDSPVAIFAPNYCRHPILSFFVSGYHLLCIVPFPMTKMIRPAYRSSFSSTSGPPPFKLVFAFHSKVLARFCSSPFVFDLSSDLMNVFFHASIDDLRKFVIFHHFFRCPSRMMVRIKGIFVCDSRGRSPPIDSPSALWLEFMAPSWRFFSNLLPLILDFVLHHATSSLPFLFTGYDRSSSLPLFLFSGPSVIRPSDFLHGF